MDYYDGNKDVESGGYETEARPSMVKTRAGFIAKTYAFMALALAISCGVAFGLPYLFGEWIAYSVEMIIICSLLEFFVVVLFSATLKKASYPVALILYFAYSILSGATLSSIFLMIDVQSFYLAFGVTAITFGCMSAIGLITKKDLSSWWVVIVFGLLAISITSLVAWLISSDTLTTFVCGVGVLLFMGVTVFDTNMMKNHHASITDEKMLNKASLYCALQLYLDFINILIRLVTLVARLKND